MAFTFHLIAFLCFLCISLTVSKTTQIKPKALLLQVTKDPKTLQYLTQIKQRTPLISLNVMVDLGGRYLWTDCDSNRYISSTYHFYDCHTSQCKLSREKTFCDTPEFPATPSSHNASCALFTENPIASLKVAGVLTADLVLIQSTDGKNPKGIVTVPEFFFICNDNINGILSGLANGVTGIAGFGKTTLSLSSQFARFFNYRKIFGLCLSPSKGVIILGDGPYNLLPDYYSSSSLIYTPIINNKGKFIEQPSSDYFIGVTSIRIDGKAIPINTTLLAIDRNGEGGTKISTTSPYTVLAPSIYDAFLKAFVKTMSNFTRVTPVAPFEACYNSKNIISTRTGPAVPLIDLVLQSEEVYWRIFGANSMVQVTKNVLCLGFVKQGDIMPAHGITIGGYQLENNLLQFNVAKSVLGFSSSLLFHQTTCANFNFTTTI